MKELAGGRYTLLRTLGEGAQGTTWEGSLRDSVDTRPLRERFQKFVERGGERAPAGLVAIKCFRVDRAKAWKDVELAEREATTLAQLSHPNLPRYIEHFEEDGALYLVMEKIEGESLASLRARGRKLSADEVLRMMEDIGAALRYLHGRAPPIVHRDIKPGNVIRRPDGSFALVDFGAVRDKLRPAGGSTVVGTFGYMAPEQFQGRASPGSDVYGLGATAIAMLTGIEPEELPHAGLAIDVRAALPRSTPDGLVRALSAMLVPEPDRRVGSVDEALAIARAPRSERASGPAPAGDRAEARTGAGRKRGRDRARESRDERKARRRAEKDARKARRERARGRRPPFLPRVVAKVGLLVAWLVVWIVVGGVLPLVLTLLSLLFGQRLRAAAAACARGSRRAGQAIGRASDWLSGHRAEDDAVVEPTVVARVDSMPGRVRVVEDGDRVRVHSDPPDADEEADDAPSEAAAARRARR